MELYQLFPGFLFLIVLFLLLALWHQVVQPAQLPLGEEEVEKLPDEDQRQNLEPGGRIIISQNVLCDVSPHHAEVWGGHHHGEDDGGGGGLDDPEQHQAGELHQREHVDLPQRHVAQVDQIGLVLGGHAEQLDPVKELRRK